VVHRGGCSRKKKVFEPVVGQKIQKKTWATHVGREAFNKGAGKTGKKGEGGGTKKTRREWGGEEGNISKRKKLWETSRQKGKHMATKIDA